MNDQSQKFGCCHQIRRLENLTFPLSSPSEKSHDKLGQGKESLLRTEQVIGKPASFKLDFLSFYFTKLSFQGEFWTAHDLRFPNLTKILKFDGVELAQKCLKEKSDVCMPRLYIMNGCGWSWCVGRCVVSVCNWGEAPLHPVHCCTLATLVSQRSPYHPWCTLQPTLPLLHTLPHHSLLSTTLHTILLLPHSLILIRRPWEN